MCTVVQKQWWHLIPNLLLIISAVEENCAANVRAELAVTILKSAGQRENEALIFDETTYHGVTDNIRNYEDVSP